MSYSVRIITQTDFTREFTIAQGLAALPDAAEIGQRILTIPGTMVIAYEIWETTDHYHHKIRRISRDTQSTGE